MVSKYGRYDLFHNVPPFDLQSYWLVTNLTYMMIVIDDKVVGNIPLLDDAISGNPLNSALLGMRELRGKGLNTILAEGSFLFKVSICMGARWN